MGRKFVLFVKDGQIVRRALPRAQGRWSLSDWLAQARNAIYGWRAGIGAMRFSGRWHVLDPDFSDPVKTFPVEVGQDVVEMYLLAKEADRG